jgi:hypothetical protein
MITKNIVDTELPINSNIITMNAFENIDPYNPDDVSEYYINEIDYLLDMNNVLKIYERFCEYLETMNNDDKLEFKIRLYILYYAETYGDYPFTDNREEFEETNRMFANFLTSYVDENPELEIYREEIINMRYDDTLLYRGTELFEKNNSIIFIK